MLNTLYVIKKTINFAYNRQVDYLSGSKKRLSLNLLEEKPTRFFS